MIHLEITVNGGTNTCYTGEGVGTLDILGDQGEYRSF
jgi:hypothetical protein